MTDDVKEIGMDSSHEVQAASQATAQSNDASLLSDDKIWAEMSEIYDRRRHARSERQSLTPTCCDCLRELHARRHEEGTA